MEARIEGAFDCGWLSMKTVLRCARVVCPSFVIFSLSLFPWAETKKKTKDSREAGSAPAEAGDEDRTGVTRLLPATHERNPSQ